MKKVVYPINIRRSDFNTTNLHDRTPYMIIDDVLVIDESWWKTLTKYIKNLLIQRLKEHFIGKHIPSNYLFRIDGVEIPHKIQKDPRLTIVYQTYQDGYDYQLWHHVAPPGVKMIKLSLATKDALYNKNIKDLSEIKSQLEEVLDGKQQYFVRTSSTSGKNEKYVEPFNDPNRVLTHLLSVKEFALREFGRPEKDTFIIFVPWNLDIDSRTEFRLFVVNRKLTCASPQKWWECHNYTEEELNIIENNIIHNRIYKESPYETFVADVYVDLDKKICNLIELNCFGDHSGAGSSLFNWETDHDIMYGLVDELPEFRYLSVISYSI